MKLTNLRPLHVDILKNKMTFDVFDYLHNGIEFSVLFDIASKPFYKLVFIKKRSDLHLIFDVKTDYYINTFLGEKLAILLQMLELTNGMTAFSTNKFFEEFNNKIPPIVSKKQIQRASISKIYKCEESDKIYIKEMRNWDKYPLLGKNVTEENREKTRLLYPDIYEEIKDKNVSVFYTNENSKK